MDLGLVLDSEEILTLESRLVGGSVAEFGDIDPCTDILHHLSHFVQNRMTDCVEMLYRAVLKKHAILSLKLFLLELCRVVSEPDPRPILRMNPGVEVFNCR
jgi:hypothetical protein